MSGVCSLSADPPLFSALIVDLGRARREAMTVAEQQGRLLADLEALHEPDANGDCPACMTEAPCLTLRVLRHELTFSQACTEVREHGVIDLAEADDVPRPNVPSLADMLAKPAPGVDRFFEALLG